MSFPDYNLLKLALNAGVGVALLLVGLLNWDRLVRGWYFLANLVNRAYLYLRWEALAKEMESKINEVAWEITRDIPDLIPKSVVIRRRKELSNDDDGVSRFILRVDPLNNREEAMAYTTLEFLAKGLLPQGRAYCDRRLIQSVDYTIGQEILLRIDLDAFHLLQEQIIVPALAEDEALEECKVLVEDLNQEGVLTRIVLREYVDLGKRLKPHRAPNRRIRLSTVAFARFVRETVTGRRVAPLFYTGPGINVSVPLMPSRPAEAEALAVHRRNFRKDVQGNEVTTIYLIGRGTGGAHNARQMARWSVEEGLTRNWFSMPFLQPLSTGETITSEVVVCYTLRSQPATISVSPGPDIRFALSQVIPEVDRDTVRVESIGHAPGRLTLIALHTDDDSIWSTIADRARLRQLAAYLHEPVRLVRWTPTLRTYLLRLLQLEETDVVNCQIHRENRTARIQVRGGSVVVDRDVLDLAQEMTGFAVTVTS